MPRVTVGTCCKTSSATCGGGSWASKLRVHLVCVSKAANEGSFSGTIRGILSTKILRFLSLTVASTLFQSICHAGPGAGANATSSATPNCRRTATRQHAASTPPGPSCRPPISPLPAPPPPRRPPPPSGCCWQSLAQASPHPPRPAPSTASPVSVMGTGVGTRPLWLLRHLH